MRTILALTLAALALPASAGITGKVDGCAQRASSCNEIVTLNIAPDRAAAASNAALFIGIFPMQGGQPVPGAGGYFDGRAWKISGMPVPAYTGRIPARTATVRIPSGVCGMVRANKAPAGEYGVVAGWGRLDGGRGSVGGVDRAELEALARDASPESAKTLRQLLSEMDAAQKRLEGQAGASAVAFNDMRMNNTYWLISSAQCGGTQ